MIKTEKVPPSFLSKSDAEFICELARDWHYHNNRGIDCFSFAIEVSWDENDEHIIFEKEDNDDYG